MSGSGYFSDHQSEPESASSAAASASAQPGESTEAAPTTEFRAIDGGEETTSGTVLVVEAYALMWLVAFLFLFLSRKKTRDLEARLGSLETALAKVRDGGQRGAGRSD